jgi:hypothetical protein
MRRCLAQAQCQRIIPSLPSNCRKLVKLYVRHRQAVEAACHAYDRGAEDQARPRFDFCRFARPEVLPSCARGGSVTVRRVVERPERQMADTLMRSMHVQLGTRWSQHVTSRAPTSTTRLHTETCLSEHLGRASSKRHGDTRESLSALPPPHVWVRLAYLILRLAATSKWQRYLGSTG